MNAAPRAGTEGAVEANFDGLVGPTHNHAGLSFGNLASGRNARAVSNPRAAARQGLAKMKALADRGFAQGVLPPHERPDLGTLRRLGFDGPDARVLERAAREAPALLAACCSASAMWTANAATVSPAADAADGRTHFTPANLASHLHRAIEPATTARVLRTIFRDPTRFVHHAPLPPVALLGDEGAANHVRLCARHDASGVELFVHGRAADDAPDAGPRRYPARQTREACEAVARLHELRTDSVVHARQHPAAIDAGVFHNDVIAVGTRDVLLCHERAFAEQPAVLARLRDAMAAQGATLRVIEVPEERVGLEDAVASYLFNSQLLERPDGGMLLVVPRECTEREATARWLAELVASGGPVDEVLDVALRESMRNGGGPACLRLRVVLDDAARAGTLPGAWLDDALHARLDDWIGRHYRDRLAPADLADPALLDESRRALDELTRLLGLGALYDFQR